MLGFHFHFALIYPHTRDLRILGEDKSKWQLRPLHLSLSFIRDMMGKRRQPYYDQFSYRAIGHLTAAFQGTALEGSRQRQPGCLSRGIWSGSTFPPLTRDVGGTCRQLGFSFSLSTNQSNPDSFSTTQNKLQMLRLKRKVGLNQSSLKCRWASWTSS